MRLLIVVDNKRYVFNEIYQHQLHEVLRRDHECSYVELADLNSPSPPGSYDGVLSCVRIRNLIRQAYRVGGFLQGTPVIVQDYDPWTVVADGAPFTGGYDRISEAMNVKAFFIPHMYWSDLMRNRGYPVVTERLGMLPRYCDDNPWEMRTIQTDFRGSTRPYRERSFKKLIAAGAPITWNRTFIKPYVRFLEHLSKVRIWVQSESEPIMVNCQYVQRNALWPKAIEILSRGCFLIRDYQPEADYYGVTSMPTAYLFHEEEEVPGIITKIQNMDPDERNQRIVDAVSDIRKADYYGRISRSMETWYK